MSPWLCWPLTAAWAANLLWRHCLRHWCKQELIGYHLEKHESLVEEQHLFETKNRIKPWPSQATPTLLLNIVCEYETAVRITDTDRFKSYITIISIAYTDLNHILLHIHLHFSWVFSICFSFQNTHIVSYTAWWLIMYIYTPYSSMLVKCLATVCDAGPALKHHCQLPTLLLWWLVVHAFHITTKYDRLHTQLTT